MDTIGSGPEDRLFGKFFVDISRCRQLMKQKQVIASGSAVIYALLNEPTWSPSDLDLFVSRKSLGKHGLLDWHEFFCAEGYSLRRGVRQPSYFDGEVCLVLKIWEIFF